MADFGRLANEVSIQQQKRNSFLINNAANLQNQLNIDDANIFNGPTKPYKSHYNVSLKMIVS